MNVANVRRDDIPVDFYSVIKQYIEDASNLVCKRKKTPHTALAAWRAHQVSSLPQSFLEPLIPCKFTLIIYLTY